jgi:AraC family transcriptional regulator
LDTQPRPIRYPGRVEAARKCGTGASTRAEKEKVMTAEPVQHTVRKYVGVPPASERSTQRRVSGVRKYPTASALLASSTGLGWSTISAELWSHNVSETYGIVPQHVEICLVVAGNSDGLVRRNGGGFNQEATPQTGAIWLSPAGIGKEIAVTSPIPQTMHLYLPTALFDRLKDDFNLPVAAPAHSIRYAAGISDDVIHHIGRSIFSELSIETAGSRMYAEAAALTLAARLLQKYCDSGSSALVTLDADPLDHVRLRRVLEYISTNIDADITLADLARVADQSVFHFARKFALAMGVPPKRYVSRMRLDKAMTELAAGKLPLAQIALNAGFSSQASFTRAFRRATRMTPQEYRRRRR